MHLRCTILKFNSDSRRYHRVSFMDAFDVVSSQIRDSWSVLTVSGFFSGTAGVAAWHILQRGIVMRFADFFSLSLRVLE